MYITEQEYNEIIKAFEVYEQKVEKLQQELHKKEEFILAILKEIKELEEKCKDREKKLLLKNKISKSLLNIVV